MRKPDAIYQDILLRDINIYVGLDDEECHKIKDAGDGRVDILVWYKKD
jgi:hypothetical protein